MHDSFVHRFADTNGIRMHYVEYGVGPLVLLCHGWPESWYAWRHQISALAAAGFRVVAPDQRGYGLTDAPEEVASYDILHLVADLVGLVHALGEQRAYLIGHDWGSIVAASAGLLRPDMFRALGLLSVPYLPRRIHSPSPSLSEEAHETHFYQAYFQQPRRIERELEEDVRRSLLGLLYTASGDARRNDVHRKASFVFFDKKTRLVDNLALPDALPSWLTEEDLSVFVEQFAHSGFRGGINWYRNLERNWQLTPFLMGAKIQQPTVFAAGTLDGVLKMTATDVAALETNVPQLAAKHLIPGAGHWIQQERPDDISDILIGFLKTCQGSRHD